MDQFLRTSFFYSTNTLLFPTQIVKRMENLKVAYDGTVRDASGRVVQFQYGDDGVDALHIVRLKPPLLCEEWDVKNYEHSVQLAILEERKRAVAADAYLAAWTTEHGEKLVSCPVDVATLYERARSMSGNRFQHESLEILLKQVQELLSMIDVELFQQFLALFLQTKNLIKLSATFSKWFLETIQERFKRCKIHPGEMVGVSVQFFAQLLFEYCFFPGTR